MIKRNFPGEGPFLLLSPEVPDDKGSKERKKSVDRLEMARESEKELWEAIREFEEIFAGEGSEAYFQEVRGKKGRVYQRLTAEGRKKAKELGGRVVSAFWKVYERGRVLETIDSRGRKEFHLYPASANELFKDTIERMIERMRESMGEEGRGRADTLMASLRSQVLVAGARKIQERVGIRKESPWVTLKRIREQIAAGKKEGLKTLEAVDEELKILSSHTFSILEKIVGPQRAERALTKWRKFLEERGLARRIQESNQFLKVGVPLLLVLLTLKRDSFKPDPSSLLRPPAIVSFEPVPSWLEELRETKLEQREIKGDILPERKFGEATEGRVQVHTERFAYPAEQDFIDPTEGKEMRLILPVGRETIEIPLRFYHPDLFYHPGTKYDKNSSDPEEREKFWSVYLLGTTGYAGPRATTLLFHSGQVSSDKVPENLRKDAFRQGNQILLPGQLMFENLQEGEEIAISQGSQGKTIKLIRIIKFSPQEGDNIYDKPLQLAQEEGLIRQPSSSRYYFFITCDPTSWDKNQQKYTRQILYVFVEKESPRKRIKPPSWMSRYLPE